MAIGAVSVGREAARRDGARSGAIAGDDIGACAGGRAAVRADADAVAVGAVLELVADRGGAGKVPRGAAALADDPDEVGLDRAWSVSSMSLP